MKIEKWNSHDIRFVEKTPGEWWAVAVDVTGALGFAQAKDATRKMPPKYKGVYKVPTLGGEQVMIILSEKGLYRLIMRSNKTEAESFQDWVFDIIKTLREASGLEAFQVFRMLDKEHQREAMKRLRNGLWEAKQIDFIKANTIANKAVSSMHGYQKTLKKDQMSPVMLVKRQPILDVTVQLMAANDSFHLGLSISKTVYEKYLAQ